MDAVGIVLHTSDGRVCLRSSIRPPLAFRVGYSLPLPGNDDPTLFEIPAGLVEADEHGEEGLAGLLNFLACSFHGGTDVAEPLRRAIKRLQAAAWQRADILLVSDGEFPIPSETSVVLAAVRKEQRVRTHGLLVGSSYSGAMEALCDNVHRFADWKFETQ